MPVLVNLFGTVKRVAMGVTLRGPKPRDRSTGETCAKWASCWRSCANPSRRARAKDAMNCCRLVQDRAGDAAQDGEVALPVQQVVLKGGEIDLSRLPMQTCWPGEPAPLITWPLVVTKGPTDSREDDLQPRHLPHAGSEQGPDCIMRWLKHRGGAQHHHALGHRRRPGRLSSPACVIGADPGIILAAVTPVPDTLSEYQFAGLLRGSRVDLVAIACRQPLKVPADAEIVIEGEVSLHDYRDEGPYGDHTGYYNSVEQFPVFTGHRHHHAQGPDLSDDIHRAGRPMNRRYWAKR
jgi:4-hydroxy-3-polyprenylbenzoate decarboxylase